MRWCLNIASEKKNIDLVRSFLRGIFSECGFDIGQFNKVFLGVSEAVSNSISHGNQFAGEKEVRIEVSVESNFIVVVIRDDGRGFDFGKLADPTLEANLRRESGRGIFILRSVAEEVEFQDGGKKVTIKFLLR